MSEMLIGYASVSINEQDFTARRDALAAMEIDEDWIYANHGHYGRNVNRAGLGESPGACRARDMMVVAKPDRLAWTPRWPLETGKVESFVA